MYLVFQVHYGGGFVIFDSLKLVKMISQKVLISL